MMLNKEHASIDDGPLINPVASSIVSGSDATSLIERDKEGLL
jgi:hypothetical protein